MITDQREQYEGLFVLDGELSDDAMAKAQQQLIEQITKLGGAVDRQQPWGKRRLAYRVRKRRDGFYVLLVFTLAPSAVGPLEQWCALNEGILRRLILRATAASLQPAEAATTHGQSQ